MTGIEPLKKKFCHKVGYTSRSQVLSFIFSLSKNPSSYYVLSTDDVIKKNFCHKVGYTSRNQVLSFFFSLRKNSSSYYMLRSDYVITKFFISLLNVIHVEWSRLNVCQQSGSNLSAWLVGLGEKLILIKNDVIPKNWDFLTWRVAIA